eukprot:jgi/Ulvmu1/4705/UM002_0436.1
MVETRASPLPGFQIVVAHDRSKGIGLHGDMPWKLPKDMAYFKSLTTTPRTPGHRNVVIMGRKTWESIPLKFRPLQHRINIVISRSLATRDHPTPDSPEHIASDFTAALLLAGAQACVDTIFVVGGGQVYAQAIQNPSCSALHITEIQEDFKCDTFFPDYPDHFKLWSSGKPMRCNEHFITFKCYTHAGEAPTLPAALACQHEEYQYLDLIREVMEEGDAKDDRTGTGTYSLFGRNMRFSLRDSFPLLTTKRVFWRGVAEELLWFIAGSTNGRTLSEKNIHIWDGNGSRAFLDSRGLQHREEMDLGPVYGFQWRHFGAEYGTMHDDYSNQGIDQLEDVIQKLKTDPTNRRIVMTAWNPAALHEMALPPCHMFCQFYVSNGELSCAMYQRSCDLGLGVPFNIASYALLTRLIAQVCDLKPGEFVHMLGDAHVYKNHVDALHEQLQNTPRPFPRLVINPEVKCIDHFTIADLEIQDYHPHKKIAMKMAV